MLHFAWELRLRRIQRDQNAGQEVRLRDVVTTALRIHNVQQHNDDELIGDDGAENEQGNLAEEVIRPQPTRNIRQHHIGLSSA